MRRPKLLDLFGGQGGAGEGYRLAGWNVYAVENNKGRANTYHPGPVWIGDALEALTILITGGTLTFSNGETLGLEDFDAIHASPPCTGYSRGTAALPDRLNRYDRLIAATRDLLEQTGKPYVIENVEDAGPELRNPDDAVLVNVQHTRVRPRRRRHPAAHGTPPSLRVQRATPAPSRVQPPQIRTGGRRLRGRTPGQMGSQACPQGRVRAPLARRAPGTAGYAVDVRDGLLPVHPPRVFTAHRGTASRPHRNGGRRMNPRPARTLCARCGIKLRAHTTRRTTCCQDCTKSDHTYARYLNRTDPTR